jgi:hypothetical protein
MAILALHDLLNPERLTLVESTEIASVTGSNGSVSGSLINHKGGGFVYVHETTEEIYEMIKEKQ